MPPYLLIPLLGCAGSAFAAGVILARDSANRANRQVALLSICNAFWALCEVMWNVADDPARVSQLVRLSALGWIWIGPMSMHIFLAASEETVPRMRRLLPFTYAASALLLVLCWTTNLLIAGVVRTSWGWGYEVGPGFAVYYFFTIAGLLAGLGFAMRAFRRFASPAERRQGAWVLAAVAVPLIVASVTDGVLPFFGLQPPRFGTLAIALLALTSEDEANSGRQNQAFECRTRRSRKIDR